MSRYSTGWQAVKHHQSPLTEERHRVAQRAERHKIGVRARERILIVSKVLSRAQAKTAIEALEDVVLDEIGNAEKVKIGNLVQLTVRVKPPTKAREGRNPSTGEVITIGPKPASVDVRARVLAKTKSALPSLQPYTLLLCLGLLALIAFVNLRGVREAGVVFALPTYLFIGCLATAIVLVGCFYGYNASGGPVGVGTATAKSMVMNIVLVHLIGMLGTQLFWGANPRAPIGG